ncbi:MAG TPA: hypothetical protein VML55_20770 [Planctomycetaceae bacterium]|nr:hypothetical protein [Planctomycetaceae bacterium]
MREHLQIASQIISVVAIAIGAGLFAYGSYLEPRLDLANPAETARHLAEYSSRAAHEIASVTRGVGIGFMTLGGLALLVPWINALVVRIGGHSSAAPQNNP